MTDLPTDAIRMCIDRVYIPFPTAATINAPEEATAELQALLDALKTKDARIAELVVVLERAKDDLIGWLAYADPLFREKWNAAGDVNNIVRALNATRDALNQGPEWTEPL